MAKNYDPRLAALAAIAELAGGGTGDFNHSESSDEGVIQSTGNGAFACTIKALPGRLQEKAQQFAAEINPINALANTALGQLLPSLAPLVVSPEALTIVVAKYWGPSPRQFSVSFMESTPADLRARILSHMNAWAARVSLSFAETSGVGEVRISRGPGGYYSYLGTDIRFIPQNRQTMNLQGFTMSTPEAEYRRVVRHETGHTFGFPHEHMRKELVARIDPAKAYPYFLATQGWEKKMVDLQVLTPLDEASIFGTPADQNSIMCYQLPGQITYDGHPILGGSDINETDFAFAESIYPKPTTETVGGTYSADDWDPKEDPVAA
jgi:hypothetical protein